MDILPTTHCFDDALEYIEQRVRRHPRLARRSTLILVHGIALASNGPHAGEPYAHAWVEEGALCWDAGILNGQRVWYSVRHQEYYAARQIQHTTRYSIRQAVRENYRTNHYGPWEPRYRALCGETGRMMGSIAADASQASKLTW